jgi:hypothetical protein
VLLAFAAGGMTVGLRFTTLLVLPVVAFAVPLVVALR